MRGEAAGVMTVIGVVETEIGIGMIVVVGAAVVTREVIATDGDE